MDDLPEDLRCLYIQFGQTVEVAQLMELEAGNLALAYVSLAFDPKNITNDQRRLFKAVVDDVDKRTFGYLLKQIRKIGSVSEGIEDIVNEALRKRNYLIHKFFKVHNFAINSENRRKDMSADLRQIREALSLAHTVLSGMTHTFNEIWGRPNISNEQALQFLNNGKLDEI